MIYHGDLFDVLPTLDADSIDACVTDPPYELGFMGKAWDAKGVTNNVDTWRAVFRVLKPGAYLLAFGGTRTYHRMTCAIEDAGFEIRDCLQWLYGSGFPKSLDVSKAIDAAAGAERTTAYKPHGNNQVFGEGKGKAAGVDRTPGANLSSPPISDLAKQWQGWGTALKPACEPIVMARKPLVGTVAANVQRYGTGAINVDACRIGTADDTSRACHAAGYGLMHGDNPRGTPEATHGGHDLGRWPANVLLDEAAAAMLDAQTGELTSGDLLPGHKQGSGSFGQIGGTHINGKYGGDSGGASRFFYVAKPARSERDYGVDRNGHPTVKPLELLRWLVRLVTPPGGLVLDPFLGSGSTGMACRLEQVRFVGIEREADYVRLARERIESTAPLFAEGEEAPRVIPSPQVVFDFQ